MSYWWIFIVLTILCWGTAPILEKAGLKTVDPFSALFIRSTAIFVLLLIVFSVSGKIKFVLKTPPKVALLFVASGLLAGLFGMWAYFKALKINPASKIVPLAAIYPLVAAVLSIYLLGEKVTVARIIGTILIITGVLLVK